MSDPGTQSDRDLAVSRERAAKDLSHIATLMQSDAFNDYFLRRLNAKITATESSILNDDMDPVKREELRQQAKAWKEIKKWVSKEELANCDQTVRNLSVG